MDDLLQRMLEVDREGDAVVQAAEKRAAAIREENASALAREESEFADALAKECADTVAQAVAEAEAQREAELLASEEALQRRAEAFRVAIAEQRGTLLRELLGIHGE